MSASTPRIEALPADGLIDEPLDIHLSGLTPGERVTVRSRVNFDGAGGWSTEAVYEADGDGALDLNATAPVSGDFAEADANAFIWALRPDEPGANARSLAEGLALACDLRIAAETGGGAVEATVVRRAVAEAVKVVEVREPSIQANLYLPDGPGPFPTVLVLGGSGGGFPDRPAALFASHGFAAVSLAYFGVEGLPPELRRILRVGAGVDRRAPLAERRPSRGQRNLARRRVGPVAGLPVSRDSLGRRLRPQQPRLGRDLAERGGRFGRRLRRLDRW